MSMEQIFTHGAVKTEIAAVLRTLCKETGLGRYWCNGILVTNEHADLSGNPDGAFESLGWNGHPHAWSGQRLRRGRGHRGYGA